jgi:hypothetical protein
LHKIDFATLPESDDALRKWLASQSGVLAASVHRDGQTLVVEFVRSIWSDQPVPQQVAEAERLGYGGFRGFAGDYSVAGRSSG